METVQLTMTDKVKEYLGIIAKKKGKASPQDYLQSLLDEIAVCADEQKKLEESLLDAIRSPHVVGDAAFWAERRRKILEKHPELK